MTSPPDGPPLDETVAHGGSEGASSQAVASSGFHPGDLLADRYRIERFLARGGMGEVYCAQDLELGVPVALKTIRPEIAADPAALRNFKQEVLTARSVTHSNVCRIYDLGRHRDEARDVSFLTMEFLPGETLASRLKAGGLLNGAEALPIVQQVAEGLDAAHRAGIVHRDFKSANVILAPGKGAVRVVITDFGLAMAAEWTGAELSAGGTLSALSGEDTATVDSLDPGAPQICGTPAYMAPEQVRGERVGPAADLYALGVTLFELRTGQLPFVGATALETARLRLTTPPPRPSTIAELEPEWEDAILRLLSLDPAARFESAGQAARALLGQVTGTDGVEAVASASRPKHSLPAEPDVFVGRRELLASLCEALEPAASLVSLLGIGGTGKTRLARHYGWESLERWPGGVWFCDLIDARDVNGIASAVAAVLNVSLAAGDPVVQLGHAIAGRGRALLILDNFEQVATDAEATVGRWRARVQEASFLVTTRERLQLEGESVIEVEPLDPETEAVELFQERARAQRPGFSLTADNRMMVTEIVRLLDGLPLAIELAASRVRMLSLEQLRERLGDRFSVLAGAKRGRHGTLRGTLDWSWSLLTPWEQSAVAQASVFQGGFTLDAAEAVIDLSTFEDAPMVLDVIQSLVDKSWLRARVVLHAPRFSMYATVQEYAAESGTAERSPAVTRHGAHFATMGTEDAIESLDGHGGTATRAALLVELDNLIFACRDSLASHSEEIAGANYLAAAAVLEMQGPAEISVDLGLRILAPLQNPELRGRVLRSVASAEFTAGKVLEARSHLEAALALSRELGDRRSEGSVLDTLGLLHREQGRMEEARSHWEAALTLHREVGDRRFEGRVLGNLGGLHQVQGQMEEAQAHYETALAIDREVGDRRVEGILLGNLGGLHFEQGRMEDARSRLNAALAIHREVGNRRFEGIVLGNLGTLHYGQGRMEEARSHYEAALAIDREVGDRRVEGILLGNLGDLHLEQGRVEEGRSHYEAALAIHREVGNRRSEGRVLGNLGDLHFEQDRLEEARCCLGEGAEILRQLGDRVELGTVVCKQGTLERQQGNMDAARSALAEAEQIITSVGADSRPSLERDIAELRAELAKGVEERDRQRAE